MTRRTWLCIIAVFCVVLGGFASTRVLSAHEEGTEYVYVETAADTAGADTEEGYTDYLRDNLRSDILSMEEIDNVTVDLAHREEGYIAIVDITFSESVQESEREQILGNLEKAIQSMLGEGDVTVSAE